jgi:hypothetical protein
LCIEKSKTRKIEELYESVDAAQNDGLWSFKVICKLNEENTRDNVKI